MLSMPIVLPLLLASFGSVTVTATAPPRCGYEVLPGAISE